MDELKLYSDAINEIKDEIINNNFTKHHNKQANDKYQNSVSYQKRCFDSIKLCTKYPDHVPIIVNCTETEIKLKKTKYLVPKDLEASKFMFTIRSQIKLHSSKAIFVFVDNILLDNNKLIGQIYEEHLRKNKIKDDGDRFLYITITLENTFG